MISDQYILGPVRLKWVITLHVSDECLLDLLMYKHFEIISGGLVEITAWWRHQMETFSALLALCAGNSPVTDGFPSQWPMMRIFDVFFNLRLNKSLSKQSWGWWFETQSGSLWRHCNGNLSTDLARLIKLRTSLDCVPLGKTPVMQVQWY